MTETHDTATDSNTRAPALRVLPDGHDDLRSPFHIEPHLRELYQTVTVDEDSLRAALEDRQDQHMRAEVLDRFEVLRARKERQLSPVQYRKWLNNNFRGGWLTKICISTYTEEVWPCDTMGHRILRRPLPEVEERLITHLTCLNLAIEAHSRETFEAGREAREAERERLRIERQTCHVCGVVDESTAPHEGLIEPTASADARSTVTTKVCPACAQLAPLIAQALAPTANGTTRAEQIAAWVGRQTPPTTAFDSSGLARSVLDRLRSRRG